jgi:hypothetical protein
MCFERLLLGLGQHVVRHHPADQRVGVRDPDLDVGVRVPSRSPIDHVARDTIDIVVPGHAAVVEAIEHALATGAGWHDGPMKLQIQVAASLGTEMGNDRSRSYGPAGIRSFTTPASEELPFILRYGDTAWAPPSVAG